MDTDPANKLTTDELKAIASIRINVGTRLGHKLVTLTGTDQFMEAALDMFRREGWTVVSGTFLPSQNRWGQNIIALMLALHRERLPLVRPDLDNAKTDCTETPPDEISPILIGAQINA